MSKDVNDIEVVFEEISNNHQNSNKMKEPIGATVEQLLDQAYTEEACLAETVEEQLEIIKKNLNHKI